MSKLHIVFALISVVLWGSNYPLTKLVISTMPVFGFLGLRMFLAAVIFMPFVGLPPRRYLPHLFLLSLTQYTLPSGMTSYALHHINSGLAGILTEMEIPLAALFGWLFLKEKISLVQAVGMVFSFLGVVMISYTPDLRMQLEAVLLCLLSAVAFATYCVQIRMLSGLSPLALTVWTTSIAAPMNLVISGVGEGFYGWFEMPLWVYGVALYVAISSTLSYWLWNYILLRNPVHQVVVFAFFLPPVAMIVGYGFGESLTMGALLGGLVVMFGVWLVQKQPHGPSLPP